MTVNNPNPDPVNINAYIKIGKLYQIVLKILSGNEILTPIHNPVTNLQKMTGNNHNLDLVNINAYIKFGEILSFCSQNIERKRNFGVTQGP